MNVYKVLMLGASGAGKTVFLASMFRKLAVQDNDIGFFLQVSNPYQQSILTNKYLEIADPDREWPLGTTREEVEDWTFDCLVNSKNQNHPVFQFQYADYAGGVLTSDDPNSNVRLDEIIRRAGNADALLVLLDGQKILYSLQDKIHPSLPSIEADLSHICPVVGRFPASAVHFVISKWDLLTQNGYSLGDARQALMDIDYFRNLINLRRGSRTPSRLIPVSSIGTEFAELDETHGMKKKKGAIPEPYQVEIPIACTLIDGFETARNHNTLKQESVFFKIKIAVTRALSTLGLVGSAASTFMPLPLQFRLGQSATGILIGIVNDRLRKRIEQVEQDRVTALNAVIDLETAMSSVIMSHNYLMRKLEQDFPESNLYSV